MAILTMDEVNRMPVEEFISHFGEIFEHSAWVVEAAAGLRPFNSIESMHQTMFGLIERSGTDAVTAFLRAHPDLAGKAALDGEITAFSSGEQARAGLDSLTRDELDEITSLNRDYRNRHGFPFIACVKHYTKAGIFYKIRARLGNTTEQEFATAVQQLKAITWYRLRNMFA